jgi:UPF0271 protein
MKKIFFVVDTSAILSGKPISLDDANMITTPAVSAELKPGGKDYRTFQLLQEKGLLIQSSSKISEDKVQKTAQETGDIDRLSSADIEVLALALDINRISNKEAIILTDDYSIQNVAKILDIKFRSFSQKGITRRIKWIKQCPGCKRTFKSSIKSCPVCGTQTKSISIHEENFDIRKQ